ATPVRVEAEAEADVGTVVVGEDGAARVAVENRRLRRRTVCVLAPVGVDLDMPGLVPVRRIRRRSAPGEIGPRHGARFSPGRGGPARWRHVPLRRADELQRVRVTRTATGGDGERLQDELSRLLPARGDRDGDAVGAMLLGL